MLLAAGLLAGTAAHADGEPPSPPTLRPVDWNLQAQAAFIAEAGTVASNGFSASGSLGGTGPLISVRGSGESSRETFENGASATALWQFNISGPAGVIVPIVITGVYGGEFEHAFGVAGGLALGLDPFRLTRVMSFACTVDDSSGCGSSHRFELDQNVLTGITYIQIVTGGSLLSRGVAGLGSFSSFIDPLITIDPNFARFAEFTLTVSPGAGGFVTAVPEPETYALLLAGLAVLGAAARRRRQRSE